MTIGQDTPTTPYGDDHIVRLDQPEVARERVHQRRIHVDGYVRSDGQYDIEAELTDHKTYSFPSDFRGTVTPDLPVHHMIVRITMTRERVITAAKAITVTGPYAVCPQANDVFDALVGLQSAPVGGKRFSRPSADVMAAPISPS